MKTLLNILYVTTPDAYLRLEGETLCVMVEKEKRLQVPLHHLGGIVCFGHTMLSPALLSRCAEDGRSVVWLSGNGRFGARLEGPVSGNVLLRRAQHLASDGPTAVDLARSFVAGKLRNCRQVLMRSARDSKDANDRARLTDAARRIVRVLPRLAEAPDVDTARGHEGDGARIYFEHFPLLLNPRTRESFGFDGRNRRPPRDPVNALLSFLYVLLLNDCRSALETVGLDPQVGYLHALRPGRMSLALDLMEEFRPVLADRLAVTLLNRSQLKVGDFDRRDGGSVALHDDARRAVITAYQERKQDALKHPLLDEPIPAGLLPHVQARLLARALRGDVEGYLPYLHK
jgi:CRISP-associated protein Cas1